jgi:RNA polymerase sigma-70 factor (ECF subfamily)
VPSDDWRDAVRAAIAGARVSVDDALAHVEAALATGASPAHAGDLAIAFAVGRGDPVVIRRFGERVAMDIAAAARAIDADPAFVDEIAQSTHVRLVVADAGELPRIAQYRGTGPLRAWVGIAARRIALNTRRHAPHDAGDDVLADIVDRDPDPEIRHLKAVYRVEFREALTAALAGLADRARALLRLRFVEGLELAQIGLLYRVHESTVSRWVSAALDDVARATRRHLVARLAVTPETADSVVRIVQSQLDLSIARLLR